MAKKITFKSSRLVLTEGREDAAFCRHIIRHLSINDIEIYPLEELSGVGGNSGFKETITGLEPTQGFDKVKQVILIADNDEEPRQAFEFIVKQINGANRTRSWGIPTQVGMTANGDPSVIIWMWPNATRPGCLETLLWECVRRIHKENADCVERALACTSANKWSISKRDKAQIRCLISLTFQNNPALSLTFLWDKFPDLIPADELEFQEFRDFLSNLIIG